MKDYFTINIPEGCLKVMNTLKNNGYRAYIVGGCVRDSIIGIDPHDWDICTNCKPDNMMEVFKEFNVIPTGLKHGTITVMVNNVGYEVTTFRIDGEYSDSRHPDEVTFTNDLTEDLSRRDFTMNSIAYSPDEGYIDCYGGMEDIKNKKIVTVGNPLDRFNEDPLRILRAFRFSAQLGFEIESDTLSGIKTLCNKLGAVSKERIREEFNKILIYNPKVLVDLFNNYLLRRIICFNEYYFTMDQNNPYHHLNLFDHTVLATTIIEPELHLRLTMLLHDIGKIKTRVNDANGISHYYNHAEESARMANIILHDLKYDNDTIDKVITLIKAHDYQIDSKKIIKRRLNKMGIKLTKDLLKVKYADIMAQNPLYAKDRLIKLFEAKQMICEIEANKECFDRKHLNINGNDLISLGLKGKMIGRVLDNILEKIMNEELVNDRDMLLKYSRVKYEEIVNNERK